MKKILTVFLTMLLTFSLTACGTKNNETENPGGNENNKVENNNGGSENKVDYKTYGVSQRGSADNGKSESFFINYPRYGGYSEGYGLVAEQLDDTFVIVAGQNEECPRISKVSEVFPAYFEHLQFTLEGIYGILSDNYQFFLQSNNSETIGEYDMHRFTGTFEFDEDGEHIKYQFVAYATTLKSNGAYAYWVVYDTSDNQTNGKLIEEHAYNMAQTFREEA